MDDATAATSTHLEDWRERVTRIVRSHAEGSKTLKNAGHVRACVYLYGPGGVGKSHLASALATQFPNAFYGCCMDECNAAELRAIVTKREPRSLTLLMSNHPPESRAGVRRIPEILGPVTVVHATARREVV